MTDHQVIVLASLHPEKKYLKVIHNNFNKYLKSLFCKISFSLNLYVKAIGDIRYHDINQLTYSKDKVLKDYDKGKFQCQDVPEEI